MNDTKSKKRELERDEQRAIDALLRAIRATSRPAAWYAAQIGVTPQAMQHWLSRGAPVPLQRVAHLAQLLGVDPSEISVQWRDQVAPYLQPSQSQRLDQERLQSLVATVDSAASMQRRPVPASLKARLITRLYAANAGDDASQVVSSLLEMILSDLEPEK